VDTDNQFNFRLASARAPSQHRTIAQKGTSDMLYAVRKRRGQWTVCADDNVVLQFETYDEAVSTARGAVGVLTSRARLHPAPCDSNDERRGDIAPPAPAAPQTG
jgi:hypothetical protein